MEWRKFIVEVPEPWQVDMMYGILYRSGIDGIEIESTEFLTLNRNERSWDYYDEQQSSCGNKIIFYLQKNDYGKPKKVISSLKKVAFENGFSIDIKTEEVFEKEWTEGWKKYFKPVRITDRIIIKPEWEEYVSKKSNEIIIEIDPGMAFGTGTHETTSLCIELLEAYVDEKAEVLDIGCGSGILSIAAAKLGAKSVTGIDIDETAVEVAKENVEKNGLTDKIRIRHGDLVKNIEKEADIVVANITAEMIISLSKNIHNILKGRKIFIISGILIEKEGLVMDALNLNGFNVLVRMRKEDWMAAALQFSGK